ncbi:hypothetical protein N7988_11030 [Bacillus cereus]|uniref:hypothetical protein n=1 Tax=Bacillus cereus TaxID=1396 RepID=UPI0021CAF280|nr:hypothetical protein [Bacillus cereus]MCU7753201.1 hypothetical protein [Bacillus cereus]MDC7750348.1 hypothetical protein [Bacillus cereus]UXP16440.1 hypothetical protein N7988_11030 [Bacillus cereus]
MEILMKSYEYRFYPAGHVYKIEINSLAELQRVFSSFCSDDGKRAGEACFKKEDDDKWLEYEEFILKYFKYELRLPEIQYDEMDFIGFEDEDGNLKSDEELRKEREGKFEENELSSEEWLANLISHKEELDKKIKELKEELGHEEWGDRKEITAETIVF